MITQTYDYSHYTILTSVLDQTERCKEHLKNKMCMTMTLIFSDYTTEKVFPSISLESLVISSNRPHMEQNTQTGPHFKGFFKRDNDKCSKWQWQGSKVYGKKIMLLLEGTDLPWFRAWTLVSSSVEGGDGLGKVRSACITPEPQRKTISKEQMRGYRNIAEHVQN